MFTTQKDTVIKVSDLAVYCYRAYRDEWEKIPSIRKVSEGTGLSKNTVTAADKRLQNLGLLSADLTVNPPDNGLFVSVSGYSGKHWRCDYAYWHLYVRNPKTAEGRVSYIQMALFSYLFHCQETGSKYKHRWSVSYLASVLRCSRNSVTEALESLAAEGYLQYQITQNRLTYDVYPLGDHQLSMIQDATKDRISAGPAQNALRQFETAEPIKPSFDVVVEAIARIGEYDYEYAEWLAENCYFNNDFSSYSFEDIERCAMACQLHIRSWNLEKTCGTIETTDIAQNIEEMYDKYYSKTQET